MKYAKPKTKVPTLPSTYIILKNQNVYKAKPQHELIKEARINESISHLSTVSKYPDPNYWPKVSDSNFKPAKFTLFPKLPEKELHYEAAGPPSIHPLLRRPLAPVWRNKDSLAKESSLSIILAEDGKYDLDQWRKCSLTTLFKDDPLDPKSFYNTHYPLLLKQVPKRFANNNEEGSENVDTMYRPMSKTPDIDMRYFEVMSRVSLSDEIVLPACGEMDGRNSYSPRSLKSTPETNSKMDIKNVGRSEVRLERTESSESHGDIEQETEFSQEKTADDKHLIEK